MILAIDLDDTIHDTQNVKPGYKMGMPVKYAQEALRDLSRDGHTIIIHTIWATSDQKTQAIRDWLVYFKIPFDDVVAVKPMADMYIDDKGYHFQGNWMQSYLDITKKVLTEKMSWPTVE